MTISLVAWPAVALVVGGLVVGLVLLVARARRGGRWVAARTLIWAVLATSGVALLVHASGLVPLDVPRWFYAVALLPFLGPAVVGTVAAAATAFA